MSYSYEQLALREGHGYLIQVWFKDGMTWCHSLSTLSEAIEYVDGCENAALFAVDELIEGLAAKRELARIVLGEWYPEEGQKELTMAKVVAVKKGKKNDVVEDLIGDSKPEKKAKVQKVVKKGKPEKAAKPEKKGKTKPEKATRERAAKFDGTEKIKVLKERNVRESSRDGQQWNLLKTGMLYKDWVKACNKKSISENCQGMMGHFIRSGYVKLM